MFVDQVPVQEIVPGLAVGVEDNAQIVVPVEIVGLVVGVKVIVGDVVELVMGVVELVRLIVYQTVV
jgi:hypothetical protein